MGNVISQAFPLLSLSLSFFTLLSERLGKATPTHNNLREVDDGYLSNHIPLVKTIHVQQ